MFGRVTRGPKFKVGDDVVLRSLRSRATVQAIAKDSSGSTRTQYVYFLRYSDGSKGAEAENELCVIVDKGTL